MILRQLLHSDPAAISDLFGCGRTGSLHRGDPVGDIAPYLRTADNTGIDIHFGIAAFVAMRSRTAIVCRPVVWSSTQCTLPATR